MDQSEVFNPELFTEEEYNLFFGKSLVPSLMKKTKTLGARLKNANDKDLKVEKTQQSSTVVEEEKPKSRCEKLVIFPKNQYKRYFDNFVLMLVIYSTITTAYYVGFDDDAEGL